VAIFGLRNASAAETSQLLKEFFKEIPSWGRLGQVIVVPDSRLNALIVHGSRAGRDVVREILTVLDSGDNTAQAAWNTPRIVPVKRTSAARILEVLRTVYATQLSSGGGRRQQIDIPEGVDKDVADVLEQINAAAAGPLLTLEADKATNSIIVLGPPQLAEEVTALIGQLDTGAAEAAARGIRVISLKNIRSELIQEVLEGFQPSQ
jgi:type II secretory pathway component GspD/PulD (secretin)